MWLVVTDKNAVIERVASQRGLSAKDTEARIASQLADSERRKYANLVIENDGSLEDLRKKVQTAWNRASGS